MDPSKFDAFTKALATSTTRRQALQRIAGILGGTALAGLVPGVALADNSACAHFCNSVFDPGPDRGKCKSDAAHGTGLCYTCGPASPGGTQPICCPQNPDGTCSSYSSATCCGSGQTCTNGTCVASCGGPCPAGQVQLSNGTCVQSCSNREGTCCTTGFCANDVTNGINMYCGGTITGPACNGDSDCPCGTFCNVNTGACQQALVC